jgi:hypothetical protein
MVVPLFPSEHIARFSTYGTIGDVHGALGGDIVSRQKPASPPAADLVGGDGLKYRVVTKQQAALRQIGAAIK